jgi:hypothetical protein
LGEIPAHRRGKPMIIVTSRQSDEIGCPLTYIQVLLTVGRSYTFRESIPPTDRTVLPNHRLEAS